MSETAQGWANRGSERNVYRASHSQHIASMAGQSDSVYKFTTSAEVVQNLDGWRADANSRNRPSLASGSRADHHVIAGAQVYCPKYPVFARTH